MLKNYFKIAWRNLVKNKTFSLINLFGLSIGLAACLLITAFLYDELSYDTYPEHAGRLYRVQLHFLENGGATDFASVDLSVGAGMQHAYPEVLSSTRLSQMGAGFVSYQEKTFKESALGMADSNFLENFSIPLLEGDVHTALQQRRTIVINRDFSKKYFGNEAALGKLMTIGGGSYKVTGVMDKMRIIPIFISTRSSA